MRTLPPSAVRPNWSLDRTSITAPISGRLNEIKAKKGDLLDVNQQVAQILQFEKVKVMVGVPESDVAAVFDLNEAEVIIEALENRRVKGKKIFLSVSRAHSLASTILNLWCLTRTAGSCQACSARWN